MTLLIAHQQADGAVWMIADTHLSGGDLQVRDREVHQKVFPAQGGSGLIAFAGDYVTAEAVIGEIETLNPGQDTLAHLARRAHSFLDFAYAYNDTSPHLFKVTANGTEEIKSFSLGDPQQFSKFQDYRHSKALEYPENSLMTLQIAGRDETFSPDGLFQASLVAMWRLFASGSGQLVGGWATPFCFTARGASLITYAYSATDPAMDRLLPGDLIPHGTAERGGFGFSLTELPGHAGTVAYWLQRAGGYVMLHSGASFQAIFVDGNPTQFLERARTVAGREVSLWFGSETVTSIVSSKSIYDKDNIHRLNLITHENGARSFQWIQRTDGEFEINFSLDVDDEAKIAMSAAEASPVPPVTPQPQPVVTTTFRVMFNAPINYESVAAVQNVAERALSDGNVRELEIVFTSLGGRYVDGFNLYGLLRQIPCPIRIHCMGTVQQIAFAAMLGADRRTCDPDTVFRLTPCDYGFSRPPTLEDLEKGVADLRKDIDNINDIFRRHTTLDEKSLHILGGTGELLINSQSALAFGIVDEICTLPKQQETSDKIIFASITIMPK